MSVTIRKRPYAGLPAPEEPVILRNGSMNPVWFQWFASVNSVITNPMIASLAELTNLSTLTDNDTIRWDEPNKRWRFG